MKYVLLILLFISTAVSAQVVQETNDSRASRRVIVKNGLLLPKVCNPTTAWPDLLNYSGNQGAIVFDSCNNKIKWWNGSFWDSTGASGSGGDYVDTIYRKAGQDSIFFTINGGAERAIKDSIGGGGSGVPSDSLAFRRVGITTPINTYSWMSNYNGTVGASGLFKARDSANFVWGERAAQALTTGYRNIAIGRGALKTATTSFDNIAIGDSAMSNGAVVSRYSIAIGTRALAAYIGRAEDTRGGTGVIAIGNNAASAYQGTIDNSGEIIAIGMDAAAAYNPTFVGTRAIAIGRNALRYKNPAGSANARDIAIGHGALSNVSYAANTRNVMIGHQAGATITTGSENVIITTDGTEDITTGARNTFINSGGQSITTGSDNAIIGYTPRNFPNTGSSTFIGASNEVAFNVGTFTVSIGGFANRATGHFNTAIGYGALRTVTALAAPNSADTTTAIGYEAGSTGINQTMNRQKGTYIGYRAGYAGVNFVTATGRELIAIGFESATLQTAGDHNTAIGRVNLANTTGSNQLAIGANGIGWQRSQLDGTLRQHLFNGTNADITTFDASTAFEVRTTLGGVKFPTMTTAQRNALTASDGLTVYCTDCLDSGGVNAGVLQVYQLSTTTWKNLY